MRATNIEKVAVLMLLPQCNMTCDYCVIEDNFQSFPFETTQTLIHQLKIEGYTNLILGGGEPTIWPGDVFQLAKRAKEIGFFVQIGTNGIKLPDHFEENENIDRWILPLDSIHERVHNSLRHHRNSHFSIMIKNIEKLRLQNRSIYLSTVVTQENILHLKEMAEYLCEYNIQKGNLKSWNLYRLLPLGRGPQLHYDRLKVSDQEFEEAILTIQKIPISFKLTIRRNMYSSKNVDFFVYRNGGVEKMPKIDFQM